MQVRQEGSVVDVAFRSDVIEGYDVAARAKALSRLRSIDIVFRVLTRAAALGVYFLGGVIISLIDGSLPALRAFGPDFRIEHAGTRSPRSSARSRRSTARSLPRSSPC